jgi:hypothetical protein
VCVICCKPLLARGGREYGVLWAHHALSLKESQEMAEALGRFREVAGTVPLEPGDIVLKDSIIHRKRNKKVAVSAVMICSPIRGTLEGALTSWTMSCASLSRRSLSAAKR